MKTSAHLINAALITAASLFLASCETIKDSIPFTDHGQTRNTNPNAPKFTAQEYADLAPGRGYIRAHEGLQNPVQLVGGGLKITAGSIKGGITRLILPGPRTIDKYVFGAPDLFSAWGGCPGYYGVPLDWRNEKNGIYTETNQATAHSDRWTPILDAVFTLEAADITLTDAARTDDSVKFEASWKDDQGNVYTVRCDKVMPHGIEFPVFGGVVTNHLVNGFTRIDTPLEPTKFAYVAFWGLGETRKNGEVTDKPVIVQGMLTENERIREFELARDEEVDAGRRHFHLIIPAVRPAENKSAYLTKPVRTGFRMSDGREIPFWHVIFEDVTMNAQRLEQKKD